MDFLIPRYTEVTDIDIIHTEISVYRNPVYRNFRYGNDMKFFHIDIFDMITIQNFRYNIPYRPSPTYDHNFVSAETSQRLVGPCSLEKGRGADGQGGALEGKDLCVCHVIPVASSTS